MTQVNLPLNNCFLIPVNEKYLVYSPLNGISALINRTAVKELLEQLLLVVKNSGDPESKLFGLADDILRLPVQNPEIRKGDLDPEFIGLIPTRSCNGACNYCDFGAQQSSSGKMSYQLATRFIDWYANLLKSKGRNVLEIHFFGGEPMMARDVIEVAVQRARIAASEKNLFPYFEISTNGQYSPSDARFLGHYFNRVVLSLDGFAEVQNKHRPLKGNRSSYENAINTARIVSNSEAELCIRCCVSIENVLLVEEFTQWLCQNFTISAINFEVLCSTSQTESAGLLPPDPVDFAIRFQKSRELASRFGVEVVYASDISEKPVVSSCVVGKDVVIVSPDGRISNCYLMPERWQKAGLDLDLGVFRSDGEIRTEADKIDAIRNMVKDKPRCNKCFCQWSCAGGCHVGNTFPGCVLEYNDFCRQTRLISTFSLLSDLHLQKDIEELINTPAAMQNIMNQISDHIQVIN